MVLVAVALGAVLAACATVAQDAPTAGEPAARIVATAGFGSQQLLEREVPPDQSVMRALRGATPVETAYGGGFVAGMLGRESDPSDSQDWFYWVDGVLADVGARDRELREGEESWWDYRDWGALTDIWALVGQWPAPFVSAAAPDRDVFADPPLGTALAEAGANLTSDPEAAFRVRVGPHDELIESDPAWARASAEPDRAGLTVAVEDGEITALGPGGAPRAPVPGARALAAAVPTELEPKDGVLFAVAGLDAESAEAAATAIAADPDLLRLRFAVAFDREGRPIRAGGRAAQ